MDAGARVDVDHLRGWIGKQESQADTITPQLARAYLATVLDQAAAPQAGDPVPQGLHWCLAPATAPMHELGADGHPARGGFLPPVPLPRRMWAGSRVRFLSPLRVGDEVERQSTIKDVTVKEGRTGALCFVVVAHRYATPRGAAIEEEQDLVYRVAESGASPSAAPVAQEPEPAEFRRVVEASPMLLFRYSALTFNGHRIHYDRPYATEQENYPSLVVHGPLQAALLLALADTMRPDRPCAEFNFRGLRPLFDSQPILVSGAWTTGNSADLWTGPARGAPNLQATAVWN